MFRFLLVSVLQALFPVLGAQVFIEPGQDAERTDGWFRTLEECGMTSCRIRLFEAYDFALFDHALDCAEKHNVGVWLTFFPETEKTDIGGWKFPRDEAQKASFARFVESAVLRYKDHPALRGWVLINEPGIGGVPNTPYAREAYRKWQEEHPDPEFTDKGYPVLMTLKEGRFIQDFNTEFLSWVAALVREHDSVHDIHVNPHAVYDNFAQYDFPQYRTFLTSLGGSAHPAWHFGRFAREEYTLAMMAQSEILRSGAGDMPWFMTEIQGGNNTYSGVDALCPTPREITQWLWAVLGCEGKGGIFWMLNPRASGIEAGEWAMVDFQGKPTARLLAASKVAKTLTVRADVFSGMKEIPSGIDILYVKESAWAEKLMTREDDRYEGRRPGAGVKALTACFRALTERGLNVGIKAFGEYDFSGTDYTGKTIILSQQIALPDACLEPLRHFVECGGTLVVEGLTGFFDENLHSTLESGFTFKELFGGEIAEFTLEGELFPERIDDRNLPVHLWKGRFAGDDAPMKTTVLGKGKVVWVPSCIALGAWNSKDFRPLSDFLADVSSYDREAVRFRGHRAGMLLRTMDTASGKVVICINKSGKRQRLALKGISGHGEVLFADGGKLGLGRRIRLDNEGTLVILYPR